MYAFSAPAPLGTRAVDVRNAVSQSQRRPSRFVTQRRSHPTIQCSDDSVPRRQFGQLLAAMAAGVAVAPSAVVLAATAAPVALGEREADDLHGYSFGVPASGWTKSTASLSSFREATIYVCDDDKDSNISMVSTPVAGDFQKLTSFGTMDTVLDTMIPRGQKGIEGKLISSRVDSEKNAYVIEYTITTSGVQRHLLTVFSLQPGRYLLALTGQALEDKWAARAPVMRAVADSFVLKKLD